MIESNALIDEVEIAIALCGEGPRTLKVTGFFSPKRVSSSDAERIASYLRMCGHPTAPLDAVIGALCQGVLEPGNQMHPLHAVGLETPVGDRPKINIYLQPVT